MKKNILSIVITLVVGFIWFYITLPAINIHSIGFWIFLMILVGIYKLINFFMNMSVTQIFNRRSIKKTGLLGLIIIGGFILMILINIILSPLFNARSYSKRITIDETHTFTEDVPEVDFNQLPLLDKASSQKLGDRVMGQMPELVSQFYVSDLYTQINFNEEIIRVTPLEYAGVIKYFTNRAGGVKGYIKVNSVNGESSLVKLDTGMKYMPSALFNENLYRKLRLSYPTKVFDNVNFEIDNEGNPYWIAPCIKYKGIGLKRDIEGIVILDPISGESEYYKVNEIPSWVDHVYNSSIILEQINDWGKYRDGYFNSMFGQKNVVKTTEGYNYTVMNDDVFLYTGVTSAASDESNIGFVLTNMRTKETNYYATPGAEEYSAMDSAKGQVQQMNYEASFPLLINLNGRPTYLMSLKDNAELVKMYAFVDVVDYQKVTVTDATEGIEVAAKNYINQIGNTLSNKEIKEEEIKIKTITNVIIDANTYYYIVDDANNKYRANIKASEYLLPFLKSDDKIKIKYQEASGIREITLVNE